eukprot:5233551-Amphidinium_carterae.1
MARGLHGTNTFEGQEKRDPCAQALLHTHVFWPFKHVDSFRKPTKPRYNNIPKRNASQAAAQAMSSWFSLHVSYVAYFHYAARKQISIKMTSQAQHLVVATKAL